MEGRNGRSPFSSGERCSIFWLSYLYSYFIFAVLIFFICFFTVALLLCVSRCKYPATSQYNSTTQRAGREHAGAPWWPVLLGLTLHTPLTDVYKLPQQLGDCRTRGRYSISTVSSLFVAENAFFCLIKVCTPYWWHNGLRRQDGRLPSHSTLHSNTRVRWREVESWGCSEVLFVMAFKRVGWRVWALLLHGPVFKVKRGLF